MIGLLLVAHNPLAGALLRTAEGILGPCPEGVEALDLALDESPEHFRARVREALRALSSPKGVLILADLVGGTPYQVALGVLQDKSVGRSALVAGMSLPMLLEALAQRATASSAEGLARAVLRAGDKHLRAWGLGEGNGR